MIEKRFILDRDVGICIEHNGIVDSISDDNYVVDLLNQLYEENKQLKREMKLKDQIIELYYKIVEMK